VRARLLAACVAALASWSVPAHAHQTGSSSWDVEVRDRGRYVLAVLSTPGEDIAHYLRADDDGDGKFSAQDLRAPGVNALIDDAVLRSISVRRDGVPCTVAAHSESMAGARFVIARRFACGPRGPLEVHNVFMTNDRWSYQHLARIHGEEIETQKVVFDGRQAYTIAGVPEAPRGQYVGLVIFLGVLLVAVGIIIGPTLLQRTRRA